MAHLQASCGAGERPAYDAEMPPITQQRLGKRLAELRKRAGFTQSEAAEKLKVVTETISRLERGTQWTDFETLAGLCTLYKVEWSDLMAVSAGAESAHDEAVQRVVDLLRSCSLADVALVGELVEVLIKNRKGARAKRPR